MASKVPIAYLACPYSNAHPKVRAARVAIANRVMYQLMLARNEVVFSPLSHYHEMSIECDVPGSWGFWERYDMAFLAICSILYVLKLPGWEKSKGVIEELKFAEANRIPVRYLNPEDFEQAVI